MIEKNSSTVEEAALRETLIGLLADFREHAEVALTVQKDIESADPGDDRFDLAVAKLDAALTALSVTVPALLRELDRLDGIPGEKD